MALEVKVRSATLPTTLNGTVDVTVSGFGTPSAAIIIFSGAGISATLRADAQIGVGFWDGTNQRAMAIKLVDNVTSTGPLRGSNDSYGLLFHDASESDYTVSAITDGIRLTLSVDGTAFAREATVMLLKGISAKAITLTANSTQNGTTESASLGFTPKLVFFSHIGSASAGIAASTATAILSFGVAEVNGAHRSVTFSSPSGVTDETSNVLLSETRCFARAVSNSLVWAAEVTTWGPDTFTITTRDGAVPSSTGVCFALALGGADLTYDVGTLTTATATGDQVNATDVTPIGLVVAASTADGTSLETTTDNADGVSYGLAGDDTQQGHAAFTTDGAGTTDANSYYDSSGPIIVRNNTTGIIAQASVTFNSSDFTANYSTANATARKGWWVAFGSSGITANASITEANDTLSAAASVLIAASASITEANDTLSSAASVLITASASITEANDALSATLSSAGTITADASITEANDTLSATASLIITADASITEASDTLSSAAAVLVVASASITEADDTLLATLVLDQGLSASITEADDTLSSAASVLLVADAGITEDDDTAAGPIVAGGLPTGGTEPSKRRKRRPERPLFRPSAEVTVVAARGFLREDEDEFEAFVKVQLSKSQLAALEKQHRISKLLAIVRNDRLS